MMKYLIKLFVPICILAFGLTAQAQNAIPATAGNASGTGGSSSYTVGQVVYTVVSGTTGTLTQGVQQPFEISVVTAIEDASGITLQCLVYPNPATDYIKLKIETFEVQNLRYQLFDIYGSLLQDNKILGNEINIVMSNYVSATYLLKVTDSNKVVKTFKIVKN